ncbi:hypothetical protein DL98DRAFT_571896 [Cadophora sp. DSE1049]|nr:hypothetical protein DL98DRAFT_571896 [Cadophora sp. DSE1049]
MSPRSTKLIDLEKGLPFDTPTESRAVEPQNIFVAIPKIFVLLFPLGLLLVLFFVLGAVFLLECYTLLIAAAHVIVVATKPIHPDYSRYLIKLLGEKTCLSHNVKEPIARLL